MQPSPETPDNLYDDAALYDSICTALGSDAAEPAFYASLLPGAQDGGKQAQVLELGCGSGRLTLQLADRGLQVTGIDAAAPMLALARSKAPGSARSATPLPQWHLQDMRHFCLARAFDLALLPSNNLAHLHTLADVQACLQCAQDHLAPDGLLAIDVFNPSVAKLALGSTQVFPVVQTDRGKGPGLVVTETSAYDAATQISAVCWHVQVDGGALLQLHFKLRIWYPQELDALLQLQGWRIVAKWGGYQRQPFDSQSPHQLLVCARAATWAPTPSFKHSQQP